MATIVYRDTPECLTSAGILAFLRVPWGGFRRHRWQWGAAPSLIARRMSRRADLAAAITMFGHADQSDLALVLHELPADFQERARIAHEWLRPVAYRLQSHRISQAVRLQLDDMVRNARGDAPWPPLVAEWDAPPPDIISHVLQYAEETPWEWACQFEQLSSSSTTRGALRGLASVLVSGGWGSKMINPFLQILFGEGRECWFSGNQRPFLKADLQCSRTILVSVPPPLLAPCSPPTGSCDRS